MADLESIKERSQTLISGADDLEALETLRVELLGKRVSSLGYLKVLVHYLPLNAQFRERK